MMAKRVIETQSIITANYGLKVDRFNFPIFLHSPFRRHVPRARLFFWATERRWLDKQVVPELVVAHSAVVF
jgi:hypothetical protein